MTIRSSSSSSYSNGSICVSIEMTSKFSHKLMGVCVCMSVLPQLTKPIISQFIYEYEIKFNLWCMCVCWISNSFKYLVSLNNSTARLRDQIFVHRAEKNVKAENGHNRAFSGAIGIPYGCWVAKWSKIIFQVPMFKIKSS